MRTTTPACLILIAALTACAPSGPRLTGDSFPERARQLLSSTARDGPVPFVSELDAPAVDAGRLALAAEDGVRGLDVEFRTESGHDAPLRIVVRHADAPAGPCLAPSRPEDAGAQGLSVAFCRDADAVAVARNFDLDIASLPPDELEAQVRRGTRQLFPDDYPGSYGVGIFGGSSGVSIGGGVTFGF